LGPAEAVANTHTQLIGRVCDWRVIVVVAMPGSGVVRIPSKLDSAVEAIVCITIGANGGITSVAILCTGAGAGRAGSVDEAKVVDGRVAKVMGMESMK
jgi:hypothetical protein